MHASFAPTENPGPALAPSPEQGRGRCITTESPVISTNPLRRRMAIPTDDDAPLSRADVHMAQGWHDVMMARVRRYRGPCLGLSSRPRSRPKAR